MSNIDKRALREAADGVLQKYGSEWFETGSQLCTVHKSKIELIAAANPATVLALLDELEAAEKRIAELEAREAEPVAYIGKIMLEDLTDGARSCGRVWADATDRMSGEDRIPLYTAPPAPVSVPAAMEMDDDFDSAFEHGKAVGWNAYLAAMLQGADGTLTNEGTITATQFKPVADLYGLTSPTGGETSFTFDAVEARDFIDGGWSCQEYVELGRFQEAVSGNSPVIPGCSCLTCRPLTFSDSRFVVCPECGNKRCPHANDHRNACTGSNEPGQEGSAYPAAPQQEVESQIRKGKTVAMEEWELGARLTKHRFKP
ncbi:ead/Ea22-like family protein [Enterobacter hormaechei]